MDRPEQRGDRSEFNPNLSLLDEVQVTVGVRQRRTGRQDTKSFNVPETALAAGDALAGIDLHAAVRQLYNGLGAT